MTCVVQQGEHRQAVQVRGGEFRAGRTFKASSDRSERGKPAKYTRHIEAMVVKRKVAGPFLLDLAPELHVISGLPNQFIALIGLFHGGSVLSHSVRLLIL